MPPKNSKKRKNKLVSDLEPERKRKKNDPDKFPCKKCNKNFSSISNRNKHQLKCSNNTSSIPEPILPSNVTVDKINQSIVNSIGDDLFLKFISAQRLGVYIKDLYPICFTDNNDFTLLNLQPMLNIQNSDDLLTNIISNSPKI